MVRSTYSAVFGSSLVATWCSFTTPSVPKTRSPVTRMVITDSVRPRSFVTSCCSFACVTSAGHANAASATAAANIDRSIILYLPSCMEQSYLHEGATAITTPASVRAILRPQHPRHRHVRSRCCRGFRQFGGDIDEAAHQGDVARGAVEAVALSERRTAVAQALR